MNKWLPLGLLVVFIFIFFTWLTLPTPTEEIDLQDFLHTDFSGINKMEVRFGDGNRMAIEEASTINTIVATLKGIRLKKLHSQSPESVGYLYYMDISSDSQTVRYSKFVHDEHATYQSIGPKSKELDELIVKMGREKIPGLLSGIEF
ncbi:hypothetical protein T458_18810 [Brevibacillus panacihumi W25]|uniref:Uncharacterized protein n=1 Tax=Brevibacillus panacihumi W25 TaxID=1408254 RepID=V6M5H9_9BACL|nr:hypothetical protein [Brevibacillus panacihumi]EST53861.1 hypothetical protein T458_18810 [Brevibacillus panacihumi W25]